MKFTRSISAAAVCSIALLAGCGLPGAPQPPSLELPRPVSDLHAERHGNKVTLTWTPPQQTTDRQRIRRAGDTRVCRAIVSASTATATGATRPCVETVAQIKPAAATPSNNKTAQTTFTDTLPADAQTQHPQDFALYTIEALNEAGRTAGASNAVAVPLAPTLPPPGKVVATATHDGPSIGWAIPADDANKVLVPDAAKKRAPVSYSYRVSRREKEKPQAPPVIISDEGATVSPTLPQPNLNVIDPRFEWEKTYVYTVAAVTTLRRAGKTTEILGEESAPVEVTMHDVFPPATPTGMQAIFTEAGAQRFIDLTWLPSSDADFAGYNIYRRGEGAVAAKLNSELLKTPTYHDQNVAPGHRYFYSVTAVDGRGNESPHSREASEAVPKAQ